MVNCYRAFNLGWKQGISRKICKILLFWGWDLSEIGVFWVFNSAKKWFIPLNIWVLGPEKCKKRISTGKKIHDTPELWCFSPQNPLRKNDRWDYKKEISWKGHLQPFLSNYHFNHYFSPKNYTLNLIVFSWKFLNFDFLSVRFVDAAIHTLTCVFDWENHQIFTLLVTFLTVCHCSNSKELTFCMHIWNFPALSLKTFSSMASSILPCELDLCHTKCQRAFTYSPSIHC